MVEKIFVCSECGAMYDLKNGEEDSMSFYIDGYREYIEKGKLKKGY